MQALEKISKSLAEKNRLLIIDLLFKESLKVSEVAEELEIEENLASHHLRVLNKNGLVKSVKKGREVFYSINRNKFMSVIKQLLKKPYIKEMIKEAIKNNNK
jgi:ArsR family transcriptional regulator